MKQTVNLTKQVEFSYDEKSPEFIKAVKSFASDVLEGTVKSKDELIQNFLIRVAWGITLRGHNYNLPFIGTVQLQGQTQPKEWNGLILLSSQDGLYDFALIKD